MGIKQGYTMTYKTISGHKVGIFYGELQMIEKWLYLQPGIC